MLAHFTDAASGKSLEDRPALNDVLALKRNLQRLVEHGLVRDEGTHWRALPFSAARLDFVARECGTAGCTMRKRAGEVWNAVARRRVRVDWLARATPFYSPDAMNLRDVE